MKNKNGQNDHTYRIKVLEKVFRLLDLFNDDGVEELSSNEIREKLGYSQPTLFRLIYNLEEEAYLEQNPESGKYRLGMRLFFLGGRVKPYHFLKNTARPILSFLNNQTGETVHLGVLHQSQVLYLDKLDSNRTIRVVISRVGHKLPAHCTGVGKVLLAHLPLDVVKEVVEETGLQRFTENTITTWNQLVAELQETQERGYAIDNEEIELGLKCMAAPVFFNGKAVAALSVSVPKERFELSISNFRRLVVQSANELSGNLQKSANNLGLLSRQSQKAHSSSNSSGMLSNKEGQYENG